MQSPRNNTKNPVEDFIRQNEILKEKKSRKEEDGDSIEDKAAHLHPPPPPPPPHLPPPPYHPPYPHHVDLTLIYLPLFLMLGAILGLCLHGLKYDQVGISGYAIMRFAYFYAPSLVLIPVSNQRNPVRFGFYNSALTSCHACKQGLSSE